MRRDEKDGELGGGGAGKSAFNERRALCEGEGGRGAARRGG